MPESASDANSKASTASDDTPNLRFQKASYTILQKLKTTPPPVQTLDTRYWLKVAPSETVSDVTSTLYARPALNIIPQVPNAPPATRNTRMKMDVGEAGVKNTLAWLERDVSAIEHVPLLENFERLKEVGGVQEVECVEERAQMYNWKDAYMRFAFVYSGPSLQG